MKKLLLLILLFTLATLKKNRSRTFKFPKIPTLSRTSSAFEDSLDKSETKSPSKNSSLKNTNQKLKISRKNSSSKSQLSNSDSLLSSGATIESEYENDEYPEMPGMEVSNLIDTRQLKKVVGLKEKSPEKIFEDRRGGGNFKHVVKDLGNGVKVHENVWVPKSKN